MGAPVQEAWVPGTADDSHSALPQLGLNAKDSDDGVPGVGRRKPFGIYLRTSKGRLTFVAVIDADDQADALTKAKGPVPESYHDRLAVIPWEGPRPRSSRDRDNS